MGSLSTVRMLGRMLLLLPWTFGVFLARLCVAPLWLISRRTEQCLRKRIFQLWAKGALRLFGAILEVRGRPPESPYVIVTNHLTYVDVIVLGALLGCVFIAKSEVGRWPVIRLLVKGMNTIFIDRKRRRDTARVNRLISEALDKGYDIHIFAEGGVSQNAMVQAFKPPLLQPAVELSLPVHYAAISYRTPPGCPPASEVVVWREGVSFLGNLLQVLRLPRFYATIAFGEAPISGTDRKELAAELSQAVRNKFIAVE